MKKVIYVLSIAVAFAACKAGAPKDYVTLSGTITNPNSDSLVVAQRAIIKTIKVSPDGTFSDTLKVEPGTYILFDGAEQAKVYLKNGYDLKITLNAKEFDESLVYEGMGAEANNYLMKKFLLNEQPLGISETDKPDRALYEEKINARIEEFKTLLQAVPASDSAFIAREEEEFEKMTSGIDKYFQQMQNRYEQKQALAAMDGTVSPKFVDYENVNGGTTSLDDLKGKYTYIDVWATWCGPCKAEIPHLKEVEKKYHGKNIQFVSISIDKPNFKDKWKAMIDEKELGGIQLIAGEDMSFMESYKITGIPRFILIDPQGNIVSADAPRPSNDELIDLFNELNI